MNRWNKPTPSHETETDHLSQEELKNAFDELGLQRIFSGPTVTNLEGVFNLLGQFGSQYNDTYLLGCEADTCVDTETNSEKAVISLDFGDFGPNGSTPVLYYSRNLVIERASDDTFETYVEVQTSSDDTQARQKSPMHRDDFTFFTGVTDLLEPNTSHWNTSELD